MYLHPQYIFANHLHIIKVYWSIKSQNVLEFNELEVDKAP